MNFKLIFSVFLVLVLSGFVFAAGECFVNGEPVECPSFFDENFSLIIIGVFVIIFVLILAFVIFSIAKVYSTGSVKTFIEKNIYSPNETIKGKVQINLKKPVNVDSGLVSLIAERQTKIYSNGKSRIKTEVLHKSSNNFVVQPNYPVGASEAEFQIIVPDNALRVGKIDASALGGVGQAINFIQDVAITKPKWFLLLELKIKGGVVLTSKTLIQIQ